MLLATFCSPAFDFSRALPVRVNFLAAAGLGGVACRVEAYGARRGVTRSNVLDAASHAVLTDANTL